LILIWSTIVSALDRLGVLNMRIIRRPRGSQCQRARRRIRYSGWVRLGIGFAFQDRRAARQQLLWRATVIAFSLVAASAAVLVC
jgi:hypothetical protein